MYYSIYYCMYCLVSIVFINGDNGLKKCLLQCNIPVSKVCNSKIVNPLFFMMSWLLYNNCQIILYYFVYTVLIHLHLMCAHLYTRITTMPFHHLCIQKFSLSFFFGMSCFCTLAPEGIKEKRHAFVCLFIFHYLDHLSMSH